MKLDAVCRSLLEEFRSRPTIRAGSMITTVFGDAIAPRGGALWLGSLIKLMSDFGVSERLVRTSVYRLANDGWIVSEQQGRRSYYSLTVEGRDRFRNATHRIYGVPQDTWDGSWCLLLLAGVAAATRDIVRRECGWLGFGAISSDILVHPAPNAGDLTDTLQRIGVDCDAVVIAGHTLHGDEGLRRLIHDGWNLDDIDKRYAEFVRRFRPALAAAGKARSIDPKTAFQLRTLLIQEYRKVILRDPQMPSAMLPDNWQGTMAYRVCRDLYRHIFARADEYLTAEIETKQGSLPAPGGDFFERFGGLPNAMLADR